MKKLIPLFLLAALTLAATSSGFAQDEKKKEKKGKKAQSAQTSEITPSTVIHVVAVKWKDDATPEQIQTALDGLKALPKSFPGITRVWTRAIKIQSPRGTEKERSHVFVMEFASEQALKDYHQSPAQLEWYKVYEPIREESNAIDVTN